MYVYNIYIYIYVHVPAFPFTLGRERKLSPPKEKALTASSSRSIEKSKRPNRLGHRGGQNPARVREEKGGEGGERENLE